MVALVLFLAAGGARSSEATSADTLWPRVDPAPLPAHVLGGLWINRSGVLLDRIRIAATNTDRLTVLRFGIGHANIEFGRSENERALTYTPLFQPAQDKAIRLALDESSADTCLIEEVRNQVTGSLTVARYCRADAGQ